MGVVTEHQQKRIRRADAADIARMVDQERYWSAEALRQISKRIDNLNTDNPAEALHAGKSILKLVKRIRDATPDHHAFALAVYASTLRTNGDLEQALQTFREALSIPGLGETSRGDIYTKMAGTLICLGELESGLQIINSALATSSDRVPALAIRGWILYLLGDLSDALIDAITVMDLIKVEEPRTDYSMLSAVMTTCNALSFETGLKVPPAFFERLKGHIEDLRKQFADGGSGYRKAQLPRLMLSRAEALLNMRDGRPQLAIAPLRRAVRFLEEQHPDQALACALDLICAYAQAGRHSESADVLLTVRRLVNKMPYSLRPLTKNALRTALESKSIRYGEAVELRLLLKPHHRAKQS